MNRHKTVLVTGGCGAIGTVVIQHLVREYPGTRFVNLDALTYCSTKDFLEEPCSNYVLYHGSIGDASFVSYVLKTERPTLVVHLAAETHVDKSFGNSLRFTDTNVMGTHTLLECCRSYGGVELFLHMSTDEVYGSVEDNQTCEEGALFAPSNPYAASKAAAEMICHAYMRSFGMPIIIMRCNNAISPYQHTEKLIPRCVDVMLSRKNGGNERVPIHGCGSSRRTFVHAEDIARAIDVITNKGTIGRTYNIGTGEAMERSVMEVVRLVVDRVLGEDACLEDCVEHVEDRAFQDYRYSIDSSALRALGWCERIGFAEAVDNVINHRENTKNDTSIAKEDV